VIIKTQDKRIEFNFTKLIEFTNHNTKLMNESLELLLEETQTEMKELRIAIACKEYRKAGFIAHKIKPNFRLIGNDAGHELLARIEFKGRNNFETDTMEADVKSMRSILPKLLTNIKDYIRVPNNTG